MVTLFGDIHGADNLVIFNEENFPEGQKMSKNDVVIILGDFGVPWTSPNSDYYESEIEALHCLSNRPWTTLVVDGNHENYDNFNGILIDSKFGGPVDVIAKDVFRLNRGYIYDIEGAKFLAIGGATSIDRDRRIEGKSYWREEELSAAEANFVVNNLEKNNNQVDYVITHTCPTFVAQILLDKLNGCKAELSPCSVQKLFSYIYARLTFKRWFFGHFHTDISYTTLSGEVFQCLYNKWTELNPTNNTIKNHRVGRTFPRGYLKIF